MTMKKTFLRVRNMVLDVPWSSKYSNLTSGGSSGWKPLAECKLITYIITCYKKYDITSYNNLALSSSIIFDKENYFAKEQFYRQFRLCVNFLNSLHLPPTITLASYFHNIHNISNLNISKFPTCI